MEMDKNIINKIINNEELTDEELSCLYNSIPKENLKATYTANQDDQKESINDTGKAGINNITIIDTVNVVIENLCRLIDYVKSVIPIAFNDKNQKDKEYVNLLSGLELFINNFISSAQDINMGIEDSIKFREGV